MSLTDEERNILVNLKTGIFSTTEGKLYSQLQTMREKADYVCTFQTSKEEIVPMLVPARQMIEKIGTILSLSY